MKRFWTIAALAAVSGGYQIQLDGRPVKMPSGAPLRVTAPPLAKAIAAEWDNVAGTFSPDDLPLTQLACTAQERIRPNRAEIINQLTAYGLNDLLCYRASAPPALVARQHAEWDPWLRWAEATLEIGLITTTGIIPVNQLPWTGDTLTALLAARSDDELAGLGVMVPALGSLVLALAVATGPLDPLEACSIAALDELWQAEKWGEDAEAADRRVKIIDDVANAAQFIRLARP